jgi:acetyl esterase/lipase
MNKIFVNSKNYLQLHLLDNSLRPLVIIAPGGGYFFTSPREALPIVDVFHQAGFHAAVIYYRETFLLYPETKIELASFIRKIRANKELPIDNQITLVGFSAGAHYIASLGVDNSEVDEALKAMILAYPVITGKAGLAHEGSIENLFGKINDEVREEFSLEKKVSQNTVPTFLFHTVDDQGVPFQNSLLFYQALHKVGVKAELHLYESGPHGLGLANRHTTFDGVDPIEFEELYKHQASWISLAISWLRNVYNEKTVK